MILRFSQFNYFTVCTSYQKCQFEGTDLAFVLLTLPLSLLLLLFLSFIFQFFFFVVFYLILIIHSLSFLLFQFRIKKTLAQC